MAQGLSRRAYALRRGVTEGAVRAAIRSGRITVLADGTIDPEIAERQWGEHTDPSKPKGIASRGHGPPAATHARTPARRGGDAQVPPLRQSLERREAARAAREELLLEKLRGELVEWIDVQRATGNVFRRARDLILNVPSRVADDLAASSDAGECRRMLESHLRRCCEELALPANLAPAAQPSPA